MSFTGDENQTISLEDASALTSRYRNANPNEILGHYFGKKLLTDILNQTNCIGVRVYYGIDSNGAKELVIVGVKSNEDDLYNGVLGDRSFKSPPFSGGSNPLNS